MSILARFQPLAGVRTGEETALGQTTNLCNLVLGAEVGSWRHTEVYQKDQRTDSWELPDTELPGEDIGLSCDVDEDTPGDDRVVVAIAISSTIAEEDIRAVVPTYERKFTITVSKPSTRAITARSQIRAIGETFKEKVLEPLQNEHNDNRSIHLLCSIPCGVSFIIGQQINPRADPPIHVYYYDRQQNPRYSDVLVIPA